MSGVPRPIRLLVPASTLGACALIVACLPGSGPPLIDKPVDEGGSTSLEGDGGGFAKVDVDLGDPFALEGVSPAHGSFEGGTRVTLTGRGFSSKMRVFVGGLEITAASLLASTPTRATIVTPPGPPGFADVKIKDDTQQLSKVLPGAFQYDVFYVSPSSGATSGGTHVAVVGKGTAWASGVNVQIGGTACQDIRVIGPERIECTTPAGLPGSQDVVVTNGDTSQVQVRDAFSYTDSIDGYRGGLSGGALAGRVRVLAFDSLTGMPIPNAFAIAGSDITTALVQKTTAAGVTEINGVPGTKVTVTVAGKCHSPVSFVDVPVDTVTAYLDPVLDPALCGGQGGTPSPSPGILGGIVQGELVFPGGAEFQRAGWSTVPAPALPTERRAAYVFAANPNANAAFTLPPAEAALTPETPGLNGYSYQLVTAPGNVTLYVIAGIEDRSLTPPRFDAYAMGVVRGISVPSSTTVPDVDVKMDILFDHAVTISPQPPAGSPTGPDRLQTSVAVTLGSSGYAILPGLQRETMLPPPATISVVGVPSLDHGLAAEQYVLGAVASTGTNQQAPFSVVSRVKTSNANDPVTLGGFMGIPVPETPGVGAWDGKHVEFSGGDGPADLNLMEVLSGGGEIYWLILAPGGTKTFELPDLAAVPGSTPADHLGLIPGKTLTGIYVARIDGFDYGHLRYGQLATAAWNAYSFDQREGSY